MKSKRIENKALLKTYYTMRCAACNKTPCDPCHIKTKGSGGPDLPYNLMPLCRIHHTMQHMIAWVEMSRRFKGVSDYLKRNDWIISNGKLIYSGPGNLNRLPVPP